MSSSGNATGMTSAYIRDAQDVTLQLKRRIIRNDTPRVNHVPNANGNYLDFLFGIRECSGCTGSPFVNGAVRVFATG